MAKLTKQFQGIKKKTHSTTILNSIMVIPVVSLRKLIVVTTITVYYMCIMFDPV